MTSTTESAAAIGFGFDCCRNASGGGDAPVERRGKGKGKGKGKAPTPPPPPPPLTDQQHVQPAAEGGGAAAGMAAQLKAMQAQLDHVSVHQKMYTAAPKLQTPEQAADQARAQREYEATTLDVNIEAWYHLIPEFTFYTEFLPFDMETGLLWREAFAEYERYKIEREQAGEPATGWRPSCEIVAKTAKLKTDLQAVIDHVRGTNDGDVPVFIKASSRSAKDAPAAQASLVSSYLAKVAMKSEDTLSNRVRSMLEAGLEMMKVFAAADALALFWCSERINQDMELALARPERWNQSFVVRRWVDIEVDMEFRGFVNDGVLNALSQYNHLFCSQTLLANRALIESQIRSFFAAEIIPKLVGFSSYIIDFAVTGASFEKLWVIELNPFMSSTDGCLFSWEHDREILENGPFELRLLEAPRHDLRSLLSNDWKPLLDLPHVLTT
eukprot:SAG31_NODE_1188_length_9481_cov_14.760819_4_plen_440_part_00